MIIQEMPDVIPNKRTVDYDSYRMYYTVGSNVAIYMEYHTDKFQPYIIVIDKTSGKRIKITFENEVKK